MTASSIVCCEGWEWREREREFTAGVIKSLMYLISVNELLSWSKESFIKLDHENIKCWSIIMRMSGALSSN